MAGGIKGITVKIGGDTTELGRSLSSATKQSTALQKELKGVNTLLKFDPGNVTLLTQKSDLLKSSIAETKTKLDSLKEVLAKVDSGEIQMTEKEYRNLQREIANTEIKLKSLTEEQKNFGSVGAQQIALVGEKLKNVGDKIEGTGKKMLPLTGAITGLGAMAVKTTADFDASMSNVSAISGATGNDLQALRDKAREMGAQTKFSASEAADAMSYMAMAGWKTKDMLGGISGVMNLAAASGSDLATTSDIVTDALTAFGKTAEDAGRLSDVMAAASSNANTNVELMGETFKYAASTAGSLGYSMEDTSIAIGLMANAGIKGSQAGTSLKNILVNMAKPTDQMQTAMNVLGLSLQDNEGNMKSLKEVMDDMRAGFGNMMISTEEYNSEFQRLTTLHEEGTLTDKQYNAELEKLAELAYGAEGAEKAKYAAMLAGKEGMAGMLAIVNASEEDYNKLTDAVYNCDGSAEKMANTMNDNLKGQFTILKSQLEELAISLGEMLMPMIRSAVEHIQKFVDKLNNLSDGQKKVIVTVALVVAALGPLLIILGKLTTAVGTIMTWAPKIVSLFGTIGTSALGAVAPFLAVVAVIAAISGAFITLWKNSEEFREKVTAIWNSIVTKAKDFSQGIVDRLNALGFKFKDITDVIKAIWSAFCELMAPLFIGTFKQMEVALSSIFNVILGILDIFVGIFTGDWDRVWNGVKEIFGSVWDLIVGTLENCINTFLSITDVFLSWFGTSWEELWSGVSSFFSNIWNGITDFIGGILEKIKNAFSIAWNAISTVVSTVVNFIKNILMVGFALIMNILVPIINGFLTLFSTVFNAIKNVIVTVVDFIKSFIVNTWTAITNNPVFVALQNVISNIWNTIKSVTESVWSGIKNAISNSINFVSNTVSNVVNGIKNTISSVWNTIKSVTETVWNGIKTAITTPIEAAKNAISTVIDTIKSTVKDIFKGIVPKLDLKLPHVSVDGGEAPWGIAGYGKLPSFDVKWYKLGGVFSRPTIFSTEGGFKGVGEAGPEAVAPIDVLQKYVAEAVDTRNANLESKLDQVISLMANYYPDALRVMNRPLVVGVDSVDTALSDRNSKVVRGW